MTYARYYFSTIWPIASGATDCAVAEAETVSHFLLHFMQVAGDISPTNRIYLPACPVRIGKSKIYAITGVAAKPYFAVDKSWFLFRYAPK